MSSVVRKLKDLLRPVKYALISSAGFIYDYIRHFKHAGWRSTHDASKRGYKSVKIYHRLEKSLSYRNRKANSGWSAVDDLVYFLGKSDFSKTVPTFHESVALKVLSDFVEQTPSDDQRTEKVMKFVAERKNHLIDKGGVLNVNTDYLLQGKLEDPELFFNSRYSIRDFSEKTVLRDTVARAIELALKTPSVCNRQAWHVYHIDNRELIDSTLAHQNGNSGFGNEVPSLLIITTDLNAFEMPEERYQHWIDGGMFSMSLVLAFHSLGLGTCCLNWSKNPIGDIKFRRAIKIKESHTVMMMLAVGYPSETLKVCQSVRKPLDEYYTLIESV